MLCSNVVINLCVAKKNLLFFPNCYSTHLSSKFFFTPYSQSETHLWTSNAKDVSGKVI